MVCPYRTPAPIEFETPSAPQPLPWLWLKVLIGLAIVFLATATATTVGLAWTVRKAIQLQSYQAKAHPPKSVEGLTVPGALALPPLQQPQRPHRPRLQPVDESNGTREQRPSAAPVFFLGALGRPTHAPAELWRRATKLNAIGMDLILVETRISGRAVNDIERELSPYARIAPAGDLPGIRVTSLAAGSIARAAGLMDGDVITAVNGYPLGSPDAVLSAYANLREEKMAVVEIQRGGRPIALKVSWSP